MWRRKYKDTRKLIQEGKCKVFILSDLEAKKYLNLVGKCKQTINIENIMNV